MDTEPATAAMLSPMVSIDERASSGADSWNEAGGWPAVLKVLTRRGDLDREQAAAAMGQILDGEATSAQIAGFMVALRMKGETVDELTGMVGAMLERATPVVLAEPEGVI